MQLKQGHWSQACLQKREGEDILSKGMTGSCVRGTGEVKIMSE